jgi:hypothetical protein
MDLHDEFEVSLPVAKAWAVLTDVEKIAPCLPGIWLREVEGDEYQGVVKVKAGPVMASYEGVARYLLRDADAHKAVLKAEGREIRGQGKGTALVTATLSPAAEGTRVQVVTVLSIEGRLARLAEGALAALSRNLIAEFAENLEMTLLEVATAVTASPVVETDAIEAPRSQPRRRPRRSAKCRPMRSRQRPSATTARSTLRLLRLSRSGNR